MSDVATTIILSAMAVVLIMYVIQQERKSGVLMSLGKKKPRAILGAKNKNSRRKHEFDPKGCANVSIDSPDFQRCASLGVGRTVLAGDPRKRAHNINTEFTQSNFLGNPFAKSTQDEFAKDSFLGSSSVSDVTRPISKAGTEAFPFAEKGSGIDLGMGKTKDKSMMFKIASRKSTPGSKFSSSFKTPTRDFGENEAPPQSVVRSQLTLGAAVSPSNLGMSKEEIEQAANRLENVDVVQRTTGGQLNLLR